jgi:hypothetical protein
MKVGAPRIVFGASLLTFALAGVDAAGQSVDAQKAAPSDGTATVAGRVTTADTGQPLSSVQVKLIGRASTDAQIATDAAGRYEFRQVTPGRYTLSFSKAGFVTARFGETEDLDSAKTIEVAAGHKLEGLSIALARAGAIEGRVFDEDGDPIVEAAVSAMRAQLVNGERRLRRVGNPVRTNDRGEYRLFGLPAGEYAVMSSLSGAQLIVTEPQQPQKAPRRTDYAPVFYPSTPDVSEAELISLKAGQNSSEVNLVVRRVRLASVTGVVLASEGTLLDGTQVTLVRAATFGGLVGASRVSANGAFGIDGVPPGRYVLQVRSVPSALVREVARTGQTSLLTETPGLGFATMPVTVSGEDVKDLVITTVSAGSVRGRVKLDGQPFLSSGRAKTLVTAIPAANDAMAAGATQVPVNADGSFNIGGVIGTFVLRAGQLPHGVSLVKIEHHGLDITDSGLTVAAGQNVIDLDVILSRTGSLVQGHVSSKDGHDDLSMSTVVVVSANSSRWSLPASRYIASTRPTREGTFAISGLPPGPYVAAAVRDGDKQNLTDLGYLSRLSKGATSINVSEGQTTSVSLTLPRSKP